MKTKAIVVSFVCLLAVLSLPGVARAQSIDCNDPTRLVPDGRLSPPGTTFFIANGASNFFVLPRLRANRSYSVEISSAFQAAVSMPSPTISAENTYNFAGCTGTAETLTTTDADQPAADAEFGAFAGRRRSFTPTTSDSYILQISNATGSGITYVITVSETTLFSPLWTTFSGFETFYRFQNTNATGSCSVVLTLTNDAGANVGGTPVTIPVGAGATVTTRHTGPTDLNVPNDQAGQARITHDCPPGAIQVDGFAGRFDLATPIVLPVKIVGARESTH